MGSARPEPWTADKTKKRPWRHKPAFQFGISWLIGRLCPSTPKKASVSILWRPLAVLARVRRMVAAHQATTPFNNQPGRNLDRRKFRRIISRRQMSRWESLYLPCQFHTSPCGLVLTHWLSNFWDQTNFFLNLPLKTIYTKGHSQLKKRILWEFCQNVFFSFPNQNFVHIFFFTVWLLKTTYCGQTCTAQPL